MLVPLVRIMSTFGIYDNVWAVILPTVGWPFGVFLMKKYFWKQIKMVTIGIAASAAPAISGPYSMTSADSLAYGEILL